MSIDLAELVAPGRTALVTQECQNGVIGSHAALPQLADAARVEMIPNAARWLRPPVVSACRSSIASRPAEPTGGDPTPTRACSWAC